MTLNPYFTYVQDYIDTDRLGGFTKPGFTGNLLRFANHDARLHGVNLSGSAVVSDGTAFGQIRLKGSASITRGERVDGGNLYRMMPLHGMIGIEQPAGAWRNALEAKLVSRKSRLDDRRLEQATAGYGLVNLRSEYLVSGNVRLSAGIANMFNK